MWLFERFPGLPGAERKLFIAEGNSIEIWGLSEGVEERDRFGFLPPGQSREELSLVLEIPLRYKPSQIPNSGITVFDDQKQKMIGPEKAWTLVSEREERDFLVIT